VAPMIVPKTSLRGDLRANRKPIAATIEKANRVTRVAEWNGYPWIMFTIGLDMSQTSRAVGSIHLFDFQKAAPQNRRAAMGVKFARSE